MLLEIQWPRLTQQSQTILYAGAEINRLYSKNMNLGFQEHLQENVRLVVTDYLSNGSHDPQTQFDERIFPHNALVLP
jgi:hypothetical protein